MKRFSNQFAISAVLIFCVVANRPAMAEGVSYSAFTITNANASGSSLTNVVNAATTLTNQILISCSDYSDVGVSATFFGNDAEGSNVVFKFVKSWDNGVSFEPTPSITWTAGGLASLSTNVVGTNLVVNSASALKLFSIQNLATNGGTGSITFLGAGYILKNHHN